jgi:hypothetical protein
MKIENVQNFITLYKEFVDKLNVILNIGYDCDLDWFDGFRIDDDKIILILNDIGQVEDAGVNEFVDISLLSQDVNEIKKYYIEKFGAEANLAIKRLQDGLDNLKETYDANVRLLEINKMYAPHLDSHTMKEIEDHTNRLRRLMVNRENEIKSLQDKLAKNVKRIINI